MKVLFDHQAFEMQKFGGVSRYFYEILNKFNEDNSVIWDLDIKYSVNEYLKRNPRYKNNIFEKPDFYKNFFWGINFKGKSRLYDLKKHFSPEIETNQNLSLVKIAEGRFDIFHPTYYNPYFIDVLDKPFVLTVYDMIHELYPNNFSNKDKTSINKSLLCKKANAIIAISSQTKSDLVNIFGIMPDKITVIPLASNFHNYEGKSSVKFNLPHKYILFTGQRDGYKNFLTFIKAISPILLRHSDFYLVCTGPPFTENEFISFKELQVADRIKHLFLCSDEDMFLIYQKAMCFVFPSLYEGFGLPILEAFAASCPVACSMTGSLPEVADEAALYFNPNNIEEIQETIENILFDKKLRNLLISKGRERYQDFNWNKCKTATKNVYQFLLNKLDL